jgi:HSP20 family protein
MAYRRKRDDEWRDTFDEFFEDFGFDFDKLNERMMKIWDKMLHDPDVQTFGPYVYGWSYKMGPDGKPVFEEFGNVPQGRSFGREPRMLEKNVREPITDLNEDQEKIYITYELPGINKENIQLNVSEYNVTMEVKEGPRKYYKSIDLDYEIKPDTASAKFNNGILDVTVNRAAKGAEGGRKISIE